MKYLSSLICVLALSVSCMEVEGQAGATKAEKGEIIIRVDKKMDKFFMQLVLDVQNDSSAPFDGIQFSFDVKDSKGEIVESGERWFTNVGTVLPGKNKKKEFALTEVDSESKFKELEISFFKVSHKYQDITNQFNIKVKKIFSQSNSKSLMVEKGQEIREIAGVPLDITYPVFQSKYSNQIEKCEDKKFNKSTQIKLNQCKLKSGELFQFFKGFGEQLYMYQKIYAKGAPSIVVAVSKLEKTIGQKLKFTKLQSYSGYSYGVIAPVFNGQVILSSVPFYKEPRNTNDLPVESLQYSNKTLEAKAKQKLKGIKIKELKNDEKEFKL